MRPRPLAIALVLGLLTSVTAGAIFMRQDAALVPVERLIANLERDLKTAPANVQALVNLGRIHAMAYALKQEELPARKIPGETAETYVQPSGTGLVPRLVRPAPSPDHKARADRHLKDAARHYAAALAIEPNNITARLGHGWVLEQAGDTARAIAEYREVVRLAWPNEQKVRALGVGQQLYTQEAVGYLVPLLDPGRDAVEIRDLLSKQDELKKRPRAITPIAIPVRDGVPEHAIVDPLARVRFDADGSALDREWTWITRDAAWLVYDGRADGRITSALQLFGSVTFWMFWANGYEPLRALDDDGNGELAGSELHRLALWHDRDANGVSDAGEVRSLASAGIIALSCSYLAGDGRRFAAFSPLGARMSDGRTRPTYDVVLRHSDRIWTRR
jgi:hypothetical protein